MNDYDAAAVADILGIIFPFEIAADQPVPADPSVSAASSVGGRMVRRREARMQRLAERSQAASPALIEQAVDHGLPREALRHVAQRVAGGNKTRAAQLEWSVVPRTTLERRTALLSPQESEKTERVARLFVHARRALGSEAEGSAFMTERHPELEGRTPVAAAMTDLGARRVERILTALEYGLAL